MGLLDGAIPQAAGTTNKSAKSSQGFYDGYFVGLSDKFEVVSNWPGEKCRVCKGTGKGRTPDQACFKCGGSGKRIEDHVILRYELTNGEVEEEDVTFKLTTQRQGPDGTPFAASRLYSRLRSLSGMKNPTPDELNA